MRIGVVARAEDRGLGIQTWEVCRALNPDRVIGVDMGELAGHFTQHGDRYVEWDTAVVKHSDMGSHSVIHPLVADLDVVYFAETCYDWRFIDICRGADVATVCHSNPEFYGHHIDVDEPVPTQWWAPSVWMLDDPRMPPSVYMPMPVPIDRWPVVSPRAEGILRVLHVGGHPASGDRNGTRLLLAALREVRNTVQVTVTTQAGSMPSPRKNRNVDYRLTRGKRNYWDLYEGHDVLVMPRRYGGLCLPAIEAAGAGLGLVMSDCSPNNEYPSTRVGGSFGSPMMGKIGEIPSFTTDAHLLAREIDRMAGDHSLVVSMQSRARSWTVAHSWSTRKGEWMRQFEKAIEEERGG